MNEWERLHQQAKRYKAEYPPGTRIMLLGMGNDPRPVEANTRGTVRVVDDIGTLHCTFDNAADGCLYFSYVSYKHADKQRRYI